MSIDAAIVIRDVIDDASLLPAGVAGIDAGLTLTKIARRGERGIELVACETSRLIDGGGRQTANSKQQSGAREIVGDATRIGVTGARGDRVRDGDGVVRAQEIEAAAHGVVALMRGVRDASEAAAPFVLALLGTGTAFARVADGAVAHLGGTAMGGGSFAAIARRFEPSLTYGEIIERASRGDRRNADLMVSDAYPEGIGRIGGEMTAAHLAKAGGSLDDVLAALLNMHGESIAQIAAGRALSAGVRRVVVAGGFAHGNDALVASIVGMVRLFGLTAEVSPHAGFAGAVGAGRLAGET